MLRDSHPVAFVPTTDLTRAQRFYLDVLGLGVIEESPFALVVRSGPTMIRITPVDGHTPAAHTILGWEVPDARAALADLVSRGVLPLHFDELDQDDAGLWRSPNGALVAWFADPDGNTLSITQP